METSPPRLAAAFAAVTAALMAVIALAPSLLSLLAVFVVYSAAITATLFVESWRGRRSRLTGTPVIAMPIFGEAANRQAPGAEERRRAA